MSLDPHEKPVAAAAPSGADSLAVRLRYLRRRRGQSDRGWVALWVTVGALIGWLFIAGFSLLGH